MLPLGQVGNNWTDHPPARRSRLSAVDARTIVALWSVFRSPLLPCDVADPATTALLANQAVLEVNQQGANPRQLWQRGPRLAVNGLPTDSTDVGSFVAWASDLPRRRRRR